MILADKTKNEMMVRNTLISWVNKNLEYYSDLKVTDFSNSWKDGRALLFLIQQHM